MMKSEAIDLLENAGWIAFVVEAAGTVRRANQAALAFFGPKLEGESTLLTALWPADQEAAEQFLTRWERSAVPMVPLRFCGKGGTVHQFQTHISVAMRDGQKKYLFQLFPPPNPARAAAAAAAATSSAEANNVQRQRLECALQLTRTVALDFNNVLTSILGHTSLVLSQMEPSHPFRASLLEVEKAAEKAGEITQHLSSFSRQEKESQMAPGNLHSLLRRAVSLFQNTPGSKVSYTLTLEPKQHVVRFEEAKMVQAFARILENSRDAVGSYGNIRITTRMVDVGSTFQDGTARLQPGFYMCVEITDDGPGMEPEVLARAFEPFFSTKKDHRGLGLAWVYGVVTNHGGSVAITSAPKQGTSVRVYLPAARHNTQESGGKNAVVPGNHQHTILIVDDEDLMLTLGEAILVSAGYAVITANSAAKALDQLSRSSNDISLVVTDLVMPQMSGRELIEQIRFMKPSMPFVRMSGFVPPAGSDEGDYLQKPFTSQELLRHVKQALDCVAST